MIFSNAIVSVLHPDLLNSWVDSGHKWPFYQHLVLANQWVGGINLVGEYQHLLQPPAEFIFSLSSCLLLFYLKYSRYDV